MFEIVSEHQMVALIGLGSGLLLGLAARLGRFCTLGAIEDLLYGGSDLRMRMWGIAIGIAILGSFGLMSTGLFAPSDSYYLSIRWMPLASILGGLAFGYGMALAGNCGYGAVARLGGGDLRSFVIVLVMGVSTYVVLAGPLAPLRALLFPQAEVMSATPPGLAHHLGRLTGLPGTDHRPRARADRAGGRAGLAPTLGPAATDLLGGDGRPRRGAGLGRHRLGGAHRL